MTYLTRQKENERGVFQDNIDSYPILDRMRRIRANPNTKP